MKTTVTKIGSGFHNHDSKEGNGNGSKNRLRIQGMAVLERENQPNLTATYDYATASVNEFFEEDVEQLKFFELNKIALGMTIHQKDASDLQIKNGTSESNGMKNGSTTPTKSTALKKFTSDPKMEPYLTDVIWSRMDMLNPGANPNAYVIKQYYKNGGKIHANSSKNLYQSQSSLPGESFNNFLCGFMSCLAMVVFLWSILVYIPNRNYYL